MKAPDVGDLVWLTLDPTKGHEQGGRRPALVLTPSHYNAATSLAVCCPVTRKAKGYPFEVPVRTLESTSFGGVILVDQIKNLDWVRRDASVIARVDAVTLKAVRNLLKTLLETP